MVLVALVVVLVVVVVVEVLLWLWFRFGVGLRYGDWFEVEKDLVLEVSGEQFGRGGGGPGLLGVARVAVGGPPAACFVATALALAVVLQMRSAVRGEEAVEDGNENEDEEEVVVLGDAGCADMLAGAALQAALASASATAGRMECISSGRGLGAGGCMGPAATWRPGGRFGWQWCVWEAWSCGLHRLGSAGLGSCSLRGCAFQRLPRETVRVGCIPGSRGWGLGLPDCVSGACAGHWAAGVCRGVCDSS